MKQPPLLPHRALVRVAIELFIWRKPTTSPRHLTFRFHLALSQSHIIILNKRPSINMAVWRRFQVPLFWPPPRSYPMTIWRRVLANARFSAPCPFALFSRRPHPLLLHLLPCDGAGEFWLVCLACGGLRPWPRLNPLSTAREPQPRSRFMVPRPEAKIQRMAP